MKPKFRAWHKELKKMFDVKSLVFTIGTATIASRDDIVPSRNVGFDELIIMQSTGLVDKNGVEVFEGDIVKFTLTDGFNYIVDEVGTVNYIFCAFHADVFPLSDLIVGGEIEVIGNVCKNPELLGGK